MRKPAGVKIWMRSVLLGASATTKVPSGATANAVGSMMPARLARRSARSPTRSPAARRCRTRCAPGDRRRSTRRTPTAGSRAARGSGRRCPAGRARDREHVRRRARDGERSRRRRRAADAASRERASASQYRARFRGWPRGRRTAAAGSLPRGPGSRRPGVSSAPTRRTGASRCSNSSPAMRAAISAPKPHVS